MAVYHLVPADAAINESACEHAGTGTVNPGDRLVPEAEVRDPAGRHFNCPACHATLTGGLAHLEAPTADRGSR
jgi:hypothetical protein